MDFIDAIVYINLDKRQDRREHIEEELKKIDSLDTKKVHRFTGIPIREVGCLVSHLGVLKLAKTENWTNVLILEDDFIFIGDANESITKLRQFWDQHHENFGFIQLTSNCDIVPDADIAFYPHPSTITKNAAGYFVHARCYDLLMDEYEKAVEPLRETGYHWHYMNDIVWNNIRERIPTYIFVPRIGMQYLNYSDNGEKEATEQ